MGLALLASLAAGWTVLPRLLGPTSTAETVSLTRFLLSDAGFLSDGISAAFYPVKAFFWTLHPRLRDF